MPGALLIAAVFAVHPLHVESVAWIIERKDVLSALCYLGAVLAWLRLVDLLRVVPLLAFRACRKGAEVSPHDLTRCQPGTRPRNRYRRSKVKAVSTMDAGSVRLEGEG